MGGYRGMSGYWNKYGTFYMAYRVAHDRKKLIDYVCGANIPQVFLSKFLMGGTLNFWSPSVPDGDEVGGGDLQKKSDWSQNCSPNAKLGYFKHEIQLFKVLLSLKVGKFDTNMYLNFSNFRGRFSAGGGQALVQKREQVSDGGVDKSFAGWGDPSPPPPPPGKNPVDPSDIAKA